MLESFHTLLILVLGAIGLYYYIAKKQSRGRLPPGPKGLPIIGNLIDVPIEQEWETYAEWGRKWGGIFHISLMGQSMIIVNSVNVMDEFDRQGANYSDRPVLQMGGELVGFKNLLGLMQYGPIFRAYRKHFSRFVGSQKGIHLLHPIIEEETHKFLKRTSENSSAGKLIGNLRKLAGGIILQVTYGYKVKDGQDDFVNLIEKSNENLSTALTPGAFLVDVFPWLKYMPEGLPGTSFLKLAREWRKTTEATANLPYAYAESQMAAGTASASFVSTGLEDSEASYSPEYLHNLKWTAASLYAGGADTTVSTESAFFLAMVLYPEVQKKAQAEIDAVVGSDRLPTLADMPHLPYLNAIMTELLRWHTVAPLGIPHAAVEDGYINGYFIPKGAVIVANLWKMLHDPETYPEPFKFDPERHLGPTPQRNVREICFGFGRRICPGMLLAETSVYSCIIKSLAVFNIEKALDSDGIPITPVHQTANGLLCFPKPYECAIKPRSEKAYSLITEL
ncbi:cytochrome P450 [Crepidotus variabilis]|uniref:Cytochrome P450 n=1 Tax=Crepidotus variabilis TaxID=179855 RepID=A0A9P6JJK5_9AGAR|nr:cytochrome P450 [Crepidotus variabilis]